MFDCSFLGEVAITDGLLLSFLHTYILGISSGFSRSYRTHHNACGHSHHRRGPTGSIGRQRRQQRRAATTTTEAVSWAAELPGAAADSPGCCSDPSTPHLAAGLKGGVSSGSSPAGTTQSGCRPSVFHERAHTRRRGGKFQLQKW